MNPIGEVGRPRGEVDGGERVLGEVHREVGRRQGMVREIRLEVQGLSVRLQQQAVEVAAVGEEVVLAVGAGQHGAQRGDVLHGELQRGDLGELLVGAGVRRRHLRHRLPQRFEGLVDLAHPRPLPGVGVFPAVFAQGGWFLLGLGRPRRLGAGSVGLPLVVGGGVSSPGRPRSQRVLVSPRGGLLGFAVVVVVVGVGVGRER